MQDSGGGGGRTKPKPKKKNNYKAMQCFSALLQRFSPKAHESVPGEIPGGGNQAEEAGVPNLPPMFGIPGPNGLPPEFGQQTSLRSPSPSVPGLGFPTPIPCYTQGDLERYGSASPIPIPTMCTGMMSPNGCSIPMPPRLMQKPFYNPGGFGEGEYEGPTKDINPGILDAMRHDPDYIDILRQLQEEWLYRQRNRAALNGMGRTNL